MKKTAWLGMAMAAVLALPAAGANPGAYSGYTHITALEGSASVLSEANGRVEARVNLPLAARDRLVTHAGGLVELALADGNRVQLAGESSLRVDALTDDGSGSTVESAVTLLSGSMAAESIQNGEDRALRIDTPDASVYMPDPAQVRIDLDARRGTAVIVRQGQVEVQTRSGSTRVSSDHYLLVSDGGEPQVAEGSFSRDRFDVWVSERTDSILQAYNGTTASYVDSAYAPDVAALDDYGNWTYSDSYDSYVWVPSVSPGWSPYSDGYWYYTPAGLSWVSYEPWGWFPFHYGNWFFDAAFGGWCWLPAYTYSPAWVYWCFSPGWVGWCPVGYYSYYSPYRRYWGSPSARGGVYVAVNGVFPASGVDFRAGWSFVSSDRIGARFGRSAILSGSAAVARLGQRVAIASGPLRVPVAGRSVASAVRRYVSAAPDRLLRESSPSASAHFAPFLARERSLPEPTVEAIRTTAVSVGAGSRGAARQGSLPAPAERGGWRVREAAPSVRALRPGETRVLGADARGSIGAAAGRAGVRSAPAPSWRQRPASPERPTAPRSAPEWNGGRGVAPRPAPSPRAAPDSWRARPNVAPAQRVIEGSGRGRSMSRPAAAPRPWVDAPARVAPAPSGRGGYEGPGPAWGARQAPAAPPRAEPRMAPAPRIAPAPRPAPAPRAPAAPRAESRPAPSSSRERHR